MVNKISFFKHFLWHKKRNIICYIIVSCQVMLVVPEGGSLWPGDTYRPGPEQADPQPGHEGGNRTLPGGKPLGRGVLTLTPWGWGDPWWILDTRDWGGWLHTCWIDEGKGDRRYRRHLAPWSLPGPPRAVQAGTGLKPSSLQNITTTAVFTFYVFILTCVYGDNSFRGFGAKQLLIPNLIEQVAIVLY